MKIDSIFILPEKKETYVMFKTHDILKIDTKLKIVHKGVYHYFQISRIQYKEFPSKKITYYAREIGFYSSLFCNQDSVNITELWGLELVEVEDIPKELENLFEENKDKPDFNFKLGDIVVETDNGFFYKIINVNRLKVKLTEKDSLGNIYELESVELPETSHLHHIWRHGDTLKLLEKGNENV